MAQITLNSSGVASSGSLLLQTNGTTTQATLDTSGNLGLGVTPSAWSGFKALQIGAGGALANPNSLTRVDLTTNAYYNGTQDTYIGTGAATSYRQNGGQHIWYYAASGTAGNAISYSEAMRLDASGNFMVGATSVINGSSGRGNVTINGSSSAITQYGVGGTGVGFVYHTGTDMWIQNQTATGILRFATNDTERARIDSSGNLLVGTTSASGLGTFVKNQSGGTPIIYASNTNNTAGNGVYASVLGANCSTNNSFHFYGNTGGVFYYLLGNGTSTFTSDARLKKNIETTRDGYIEDLCKLRVVKYNWNNSEDIASKELGLIAQEVEQVFPNLVQDALHSSDDGNTYKTLKISVLPFMLLKAIQEQQQIITQLQADVAALKGQA